MVIVPGNDSSWGQFHRQWFLMRSVRLRSFAAHELSEKTIMKEKPRILIAYDGSECAEIALADLKGAGLSPETEALVMCVAEVFVPLPVDNEVEETVPMYVPDVVRRAHERAQQKLEEAKALAKRASEQVKVLFPRWQVRFEALADSPAWALIRTAEQWKPDLIAMGARGHSVFGGRLILG